jgi:serine/threonine protein kinase
VTVYQSETIQEHEPCVIKEFCTEESPHSGGPQKREQEFKILRSLRHPNIVSLLGWGRTHPQSHPFHVFSHIQGTPLDVYSERCSPNDLLELSIQITSTLAFCHRKGIVHADLTPANILVSSSSDGTPSATLLDFSESRFASDISCDRHLRLTPQFAAPELFNTFIPTLGSDLYSLGAVLLSCIAGNPAPHRVVPARSRHTSHLVNKSDSSLRSDLEAVLRPLLNPEPTKRPFAASSILGKLLQVASAHGSARAIPSHDPYLASMPMVARDTSLGAIKSSLATIASVQDPVLHLHYVVGPPGTGKSRLLYEAITLAYSHNYVVRQISPTADVQHTTDGRPLLLLADVNAHDQNELVIPRIPNGQRVVLFLTVLSRHGLRQLQPHDPALSPGTLSHVHVHHLLPLTETDLAAAVSAGLGVHALGQASILLHRWSGGNPRLAWTLLASYLHNNTASLRDHSLAISSQAPSPWVTATPEATVAQIIALLAPLELEIVRLLAAARAPLTYAVLAAASRCSLEVITSYVGDLHKCGIVTVSSANNVTRVCLYDAYSEALLCSEASVLYALKERLAEVVQLTSETPHDSLVAARLFSDVGLVERARDLRIDAASRSLAVHRYVDAITALEAVLSERSLPLAARASHSLALVTALRGLGRTRCAFRPS